MADFLQPKHDHNRTTGLATAVWAARILFLVIGIASTAVLMARFALPYLLSLLSFSSHLPKRLWTSLVSWLAPPYLFVAVHFIIMAIWKLHGHQRPEEDPPDIVDDSPLPPLPADLSTKPTEPVISTLDPQVEEIRVEDHRESEPASCDIHTVITTSSSDIIAAAVDNEKSTEQQRPPPPLPPEIEIKDDMDYTPSSDPDSIDATWQAIMEGKSSPIKNPLKKSDTWEKTSHGPQAKPAPVILARAAAAMDCREFKKPHTFREAKTTSKDEEEAAVAKKEMRKSKTFRESTRAAAVAAAGWRGRDVLAVGNDELFSKVEAFIRMNYDQMRIQRQESEQKKQHYVEMILLLSSPVLFLSKRGGRTKRNPIRRLLFCRNAGDG